MRPKARGSHVYKSHINPRAVNLSVGGSREEWVVGKDVHECTILVDEIGPCIPSPDERSAAAPKEECTLPKCPGKLMRDEEDCPLAKQPDQPPVSAQGLREISQAVMRRETHSADVRNLDKLAAWLERRQ